MGNACGGCCSWIFPSENGYDKDGKRSNTVLLDEENTWFEQDTVPLVSARYDNDDIGSDCVVTKTVVMRSPRATSAVTSTTTTSKSTASRAASTASASSGGSGRSSKLTKPPSRGLICIDKSDDEAEAQAKSTHYQSTRKESHERRHTDRSSVVESTGSYESANSHSSSSSLTASSNFVVVEQDAAGDSRETSAHDDDESSQPSSPKSPSKGSKTPGSPKKARYGRKNYRANSGRKKNE